MATKKKKRLRMKHKPQLFLCCVRELNELNLNKFTGFDFVSPKKLLEKSWTAYL
uniref:Uncharacterized protein n=1 Tax=Octopus bimaculoides TaxID=37653 RepID=A0A0L8I179_OCTBM